LSRADYFSFALSSNRENAERIYGLSGIEKENIIDDLFLGLVRMAIDERLQNASY
jgi:hypothetical protein